MAATGSEVRVTSTHWDTVTIPNNPRDKVSKKMLKLDFKIKDLKKQ